MTWQSRSVQCCTYSNWVHLKCSLLSFARFRALGRSHSWSRPSCCVPVFLRHTYQQCDFLLGLLQLVYLHCSIWSIWPPLLMQHSHPTLAFKPLILFVPTLYLLPLHPYHRSCSWLFLFTSCFLFPSLTPSGFFNGMLGVSEPRALNCYTLFDLILLTSFVSTNLT